MYGRVVIYTYDEDKDEFWHLQAKASRRAASAGKPLFPRAAQVTGSVLPVETRWFLPRVEALRGDQLLEIVRILDMQMNNTSVILPTQQSLTNRSVPCLRLEIPV